MQRRPVRTCVACRQEAGKTDLIRFVRRPEGQIELDRTGRAPGRGAYVHASAGCLEAAQRRRSLDRALRAPVPPDLWAELRPGNDSTDLRRPGPAGAQVSNSRLPA